jgi:hypothetical protein
MRTLSTRALTAQGWPALEATTVRGRPVLYVHWEDHRTSPVADNPIYDVFWSKKVGSGGWQSNGRLTDVSSLSDFIFLGDYFDITVSRGGDGDHNDPFVYGIWTDRRDEPTIFDFDDDIWGARIPPSERIDDDDDD